MEQLWWGGRGERDPRSPIAIIIGNHQIGMGLVARDLTRPWVGEFYAPIPRSSSECFESSPYTAFRIPKLSTHVPVEVGRNMYAVRWKTVDDEN